MAGTATVCSVQGLVGIGESGGQIAFAAFLCDSTLQLGRIL